MRDSKIFRLSLMRLALVRCARTTVRTLEVKPYKHGIYYVWAIMHVFRLYNFYQYYRCLAFCEATREHLHSYKLSHSVRFYSLSFSFVHYSSLAHTISIHCFHSFTSLPLFFGLHKLFPCVIFTDWNCFRFDFSTNRHHHNHFVYTNHWQSISSCFFSVGCCFCVLCFSKCCKGHK